ncbi:MAG: hypothetical protein H0W73_13695 [Bacteroidetes bacterium]|nr:hypothetical protein [Bacteroidota bacterium]
MKKNAIILLAASILFAFTACNNSKDPTEPRNAGFHQEILPKGRKSDIDTNSTLTVGQQDSVSQNQ